MEEKQWRCFGKALSSNHRHPWVVERSASLGCTITSRHGSQQSQWRRPLKLAQVTCNLGQESCISRSQLSYARALLAGALPILTDMVSTGLHVDLYFAHERIILATMTSDLDRNSECWNRARKELSDMEDKIIWKNKIKALFKR